LANPTATASLAAELAWWSIWTRISAKAIAILLDGTNAVLITATKQTPTVYQKNVLLFYCIFKQRLRQLKQYEAIHMP
jgi:hypothetical protein